MMVIILRYMHQHVQPLNKTKISIKIMFLIPDHSRLDQNFQDMDMAMDMDTAMATDMASDTVTDTDMDTDMEMTTDMDTALENPVLNPLQSPQLNQPQNQWLNQQQNQPLNQLLNQWLNLNQLLIQAYSMISNTYMATTKIYIGFLESSIAFNKDNPNGGVALQTSLHLQA